MLFDLHLSAFLNALQLSINTKIDGGKILGTANSITISIRFTENQPEDPKLKILYKILGKDLNWGPSKTLKWENTNLKNVKLITDLLMLSRLDSKTRL